MKSAFSRGYSTFTDIAGAAHGAYRAEAYVGRIADACNELENNINAFKGFETEVKKLKGDVQEFRSSGTFNIEAALNDSSYKSVVDRSHEYASADITTNWGESYGLKALFNGTASAKAQSISHFQRFMEYKSISGRADLTFEVFIAEKGLDPNTVLASDPIYSGQMRLIPSDQLDEAIAFLKKQIANKNITNLEEVERYRETLEKLTSRIVAPDGTQSAEATTQELLDIAKKGKEGKYIATEDGFSPEQLVKLQHVLNQGVKAGLTAATITLVLKTAPEIYKCLDDLISCGEVDEEQLKAVGFAALDGSTEGFIRGFVSATVTTSCSAGLLGETLKSVSPEVVGAMTVIMMNTLKDSFLVAKGSISKNEFTYNLQRNMFVTACGIGGGALVQTCMPMIPFAYLLGNFVGSMAGSFAFVAYDQAVLSYCVSSGSTFFGLVDQDYKLPDEVLNEIGLELFEYEEYFPDEYSFDVYDPSFYEPEVYDADMIKILRRGVIGVRQVGYI
jgi:hypothetical protein